MTVENPSEIRLASGVSAKVLVMRPRHVSVDPGFEDTPTQAERAAALVIHGARIGQALVPVPGPQVPLREPEVWDHRDLGPVDIFSTRAKAAIEAGTFTAAPVFMLRARAAGLDADTLIANANYFLFNTPDLDAPWNAYGDPIGLVMASGVLAYAPQLPRACFLMKDGAADVRRIGFSDCAITLPNGEPVRPHGFGRPQSAAPMTAFARYFGAQAGRTPQGDGYDLAYIGQHPAAGAQAGGMPIPRAGCVIRFASRDAAMAALGPLRLEIAGDWRDGVQAGPQILAGGEVLDQAQDVFATEHMTETPDLPEPGDVSPARWKANWDETRAARLGAGVSADGRPILIAVAGSSSSAEAPKSQGATLRDLALLMAEHGARDALHLDGGGSTQVFGQGGGALIAPADMHHEMASRAAQYDRPVPTWLRLVF